MISSLQVSVFLSNGFRPGGCARNGTSESPSPSDKIFDEFDERVESFLGRNSIAAFADPPVNKLVEAYI